MLAGSPVLGFIAIMILGCTLASAAPPGATAIAPLQPTLTPTSPDIAGWETLAPGIWTRTLPVEAPYSLLAFKMLVVRLDPAQTSIRVHYEPTEWYSIPQWAEFLPGALVVVNGSFFTAEGYAVGLVVTDGQYFGTSLHGYGGMMEISGAHVSLRYLVTDPYLGEQYDQAVQGFPMLIQPGGIRARSGEGFEVPSRRTVVAQDRNGHIYFMTTLEGLISLGDLQGWLLSIDLELDSAFGLDGGKSSGLYLAAPDGSRIYPSIDPIPVVIAVYGR